LSDYKLSTNWQNFAQVTLQLKFDLTIRPISSKTKGNL